MGWLLLHKTAAVALSYGAGLLNPQVIRPLADRLTATIHHAVKTIVGGTWAVYSDALLQIATEFGGMGLRLIASHLYAEATYWATWLPRATYWARSNLLTEVS